MLRYGGEVTEAMIQEDCGDVLDVVKDLDSSRSEDNQVYIINYYKDNFTDDKKFYFLRPLYTDSKGLMILSNQWVSNFVVRGIFHHRRMATV